MALKTTLTHLIIGCVWLLFLPIILLIPVFLMRFFRALVLILILLFSFLTSMRTLILCGLFLLLLMRLMTMTIFGSMLFGMVIGLTLFILLFPTMRRMHRILLKRHTSMIELTEREVDLIVAALYSYVDEDFFFLQRLVDKLLKGGD